MCMTGIVHPKVNITSYLFGGGGGGGGHLWLESWICNPKVVGSDLRSDRITMTEVRHRTPRRHSNMAAH